MSCKNDYDISVIVPIFNGESYIDKCLSSILNQNVKKEIILVDDGSSDNSVEIIQSYAAKHDNVFVITQSNMHAGIARNAGIKAAHGKYVHFLDVDDTLEPNCYDSVLPFAISNQLDLIKVRSNVIDAESKLVIKDNWYCLNCNLETISNDLFQTVFYDYDGFDIFLRAGVAPWSGLFSREFLLSNDIWFNGLKRVNDRSFYIQAVSCAKKKAFFDGYVVNHTINNPNSLAGGRKKGIDYDCFIESMHIVEQNSSHFPKMIRDSILKMEIENFAIDYLSLPQSAHEKYDDIVREQVVKRFESVPGFYMNYFIGLLRNKVGYTIHPDLYIFGAGFYGKALHEFLTGRGIAVKGFLQTTAGDNEYIQDIPVFDLSYLSKQKKKDSIVLLSVSDRRLRVLAKSRILMDDSVYEENIIDCSQFIESNCLNRTHDYFCLLCGSNIDGFVPHGEDLELFNSHHIIGGGIRGNARCPVCNGIDRYRWCFYVISHYTDILTTPCSILHFAPERTISDLIQTNNQCFYVTADIDKNMAMLAIDATDIPFQSESFDYVIANHILEHIPDDTAALSEIHRVLKDDGVAIISFPICTDDVTYEDETITSEDERLIRFGHKGHVRIYGTDYMERLNKAGFSVEIKSPKDELPQYMIERFGIYPEDIILLLRKA